MAERQTWGARPKCYYPLPVAARQPRRDLSRSLNSSTRSPLAVGAGHPTQFLVAGTCHLDADSELLLRLNAAGGNQNSWTRL